MAIKAHRRTGMAIQNRRRSTLTVLVNTAADGYASIAGGKSVTWLVSVTSQRDKLSKIGSDQQSDRGNKAFIVINGERFTLSQTLQTGLPSGTYCNIIMGSVSGGQCVEDNGSSAPTITVNDRGYASFSVGTGDDPVAAIHVDAKL